MLNLFSIKVESYTGKHYQLIFYLYNVCFRSNFWLITFWAPGFTLWHEYKTTEYSVILVIVKHKWHELDVNMTYETLQQFVLEFPVWIISIFWRPVEMIHKMIIENSVQKCISSIFRMHILEHILCIFEKETNWGQSKAKFNGLKLPRHFDIC